MLGGLTSWTASGNEAEEQGPPLSACVSSRDASPIFFLGPWPLSVNESESG